MRARGPVPRVRSGLVAVSALDLAALIGRRGILHGDTLPVSVTVTDARLAYGVLRYVVTNGLGVATVNADRVTLDE